MYDGWRGSWLGIISQGDKAAFRCCSLFQDKFITPQLVCEDFNPTVSLLLYWHNPACTVPAVLVNISCVPVKEKSRMLCSSVVTWKLKPEHRRVDFFHALSKKHINYVCILISLLIWQFSFNSTELSKHSLRHSCDFLTCDYAVSDHFHCSCKAFKKKKFFRQLFVSKRKAQIKSLYATSEHGKQMSPTLPLRRSEELKGEWIADEC